MKQNNELIKQIREAYAKENGYSSFAIMAGNVNIVPRDISEIAKRYAEAVNSELQAKIATLEQSCNEKNAVITELNNTVTNLQAKCESLEKERYETRLAMRMLLKVFRGVGRSPEQVKYYEQADYILGKYYHVDDVLRNEAPEEEEKE
jgi:uncharacterized coiled-coil protein SlyX